MVIYKTIQLNIEQYSYIQNIRVIYKIIQLYKEHYSCMHVNKYSYIIIEQSRKPLLVPFAWKELNIFCMENKFDDQQNSSRDMDKFFKKNCVFI